MFALRNASATASGITSTAVTSQSDVRWPAPWQWRRSRCRGREYGTARLARRQRLLYQTFGIRAGDQRRRGDEQRQRPKLALPDQMSNRFPRWRRTVSASSLAASSAESVVSPKAKIQFAPGR